MYHRNCLPELSWLAPAPNDFKARIKGLKADFSDATEVLKLAASRLNATQSASLGKLIQNQCDSGNTIHSLSQFSLGVVSNATTEVTAACFAAASARHGVQLNLSLAPYDQLAQQALDPESLTNTSEHDAVLIAVDYHWLSNAADGSTDADSSLSQMRELIENFRSHGNSASIVQTIPLPPISLFGNYDRRVPSSIRSRIASYNENLIELAQQTNSYVLDIAAIAERIGTDQWFDPVQWNAYKLPFSGEYNLIYADALGRLLGSIRGKAKKCLVLDLDNTVWGGVIGDDGVEGIQIGQGSTAGEAFLSVQRLALELKDRGIILAVCSKNNDETARSGFRNNPDMLLQESDIAVFQANWVDKATNLEAIAETLNIGIDSLVLLDDNPAERAQVRAALPGVGVPELPDDPAMYPLFLMSAGYFETTAFSADDKLRAESYASNAQRSEIKARSRDLGDYLASLNMELSARPFDTSGLDRITQLINKTNQFNLTTTRSTVSDVEELISNSDYYTLQVRLKDSFGDLGMIGVVIISKNSRQWKIDQWLMSCRVLGRNVEQAMLSIIMKDAHIHNAESVTGLYVPTPKNNMVKDHYSKLGFKLTSENDSGRRTFLMKPSEFVLTDLPMTISHQSQTDQHHQIDAQVA